MVTVHSFKRINDINTHQQTLILLCARIDRNEGIANLILAEKRKLIYFGHLTIQTAR